MGLAYGILVYLLARIFPMINFPAMLHPALNILGVLLILVGLPYYFLAVRAMTRAFKAKELATTGVYAVCRHPLYGSWIVFLAPGIVLLTHSWLALSVPVVIHCLARHGEGGRGLPGRHLRRTIPAIQGRGAFCQSHGVDQKTVEGSHHLAQSTIMSGAGYSEG